MSCEDWKCQLGTTTTKPLLDPQNLLVKTAPTVVSTSWYEAPDLVWLTDWMNSEEISSLDELKGQVVAVKFWTLGCINCIRTFDEVEALYQKYKDEGFTILWLHAPEFAYERKLENVENAVEKYWLSFPIALDNDFTTWRAYKNRYWPAFYLIDKEGNVRYTHFWEWKYEEKDIAVQELLAE